MSSNAAISLAPASAQIQPAVPGDAARLAEILDRLVRDVPLGLGHLQNCREAQELLAQLAPPPALAQSAAASLRDALAAMRDLANGWTVDELHKAPRDIDLDAQDVLAQLDAAAVTR